MSSLKAGACVYLPDESGKNHLAVLLTDPEDGNPRRGLFVNFESLDQYSDQTVVLSEGHSFIRRPTCVRYPGARILDIDQVERAILNRRYPHINLHDSEPYCSSDLLEILRNGLLTSRRCPIKYQNYLRQRLGI